MLFKLGCFVLLVSVVIAGSGSSSEKKDKQIPIPENKTPVNATELTKLKANLSSVWTDAVMAFASAVTELTDIAGKPLVDRVDKLKTFTDHLEDAVDDCKKATRRLIRISVRVYIFGVKNDPTCAPNDKPCIDMKVDLVSADLKTARTQITPKCNHLKDLLKTFGSTITKSIIVTNEPAIKQAITDDVICIADIMNKKMQLNIPDMPPIDKQNLKTKLFTSLVKVTNTWRTVISFFYRVCRLIDAFEGSNESPDSPESDDPYSNWIPSNSGEVLRRRNLQTERLRKFLKELQDLVAVK